MLLVSPGQIIHAKMPLCWLYQSENVRYFLGGNFQLPHPKTDLTLPMAAVLYPALLAMLARLVSLLGNPALPAAEMITGGVLANPGELEIMQRHF